MKQATLDKIIKGEISEDMLIKKYIITHDGSTQTRAIINKFLQRVVKTEKESNQVSGDLSARIQKLVDDVGESTEVDADTEEKGDEGKGDDGVEEEKGGVEEGKGDDGDKKVIWSQDKIVEFEEMMNKMTAKQKREHQVYNPDTGYFIKPTNHVEIIDVLNSYISTMGHMKSEIDVGFQQYMDDVVDISKNEKYKKHSDTMADAVNAELEKDKKDKKDKIIKKEKEADDFDKGHPENKVDSHQQFLTDVMGTDRLTLKLESLVTLYGKKLKKRHARVKMNFNGLSQKQKRVMYKKLKEMVKKMLGVSAVKVEQSIQSKAPQATSGGGEKQYGAIIPLTGIDRETLIKLLQGGAGGSGNTDKEPVKIAQQQLGGGTDTSGYEINYNDKISHGRRKLTTHRASNVKGRMGMPIKPQTELNPNLNKGEYTPMRQSTRKRGRRL